MPDDTSDSRRWAALFELTVLEPEFLLAVYETMTTDRAREWFLRTHGRSVLAGHGSTIARARSRSLRTYGDERYSEIPPPDYPPPRFSHR